MSFSANLGFQPFGQRVDGLDPHAVQSAGADLVTAFAVELAACMDIRQHDFQGRLIVFFRHGADGNAAPVVRDRDAAVGMNHDRKLCGESVGTFVDAIIDQFVDQMVQPHRRRIADIHRRAMPDPLPAPFKA